MNSKQLSFDLSTLPKDDKTKRRKKWRIAFQKWSDKQQEDETNSLGHCGYMACCNYCDLKGKGNDCANAVCYMYEVKFKKEIDFTDFDFANWAEGRK